MAKTKYMKPEARKDQILEAAVAVAERDGYTHVRREEVANHIGCSVGTVSRYFNTMNQLRKAVMRHAVHTINLQLIGQGLALRDSQALKASEEIKEQALNHVLKGS